MVPRERAMYCVCIGSIPRSNMRRWSAKGTPSTSGRLRSSSADTAQHRSLAPNLLLTRRDPFRLALLRAATATVRRRRRRRVQTSGYHVPRDRLGLPVARLLEEAGGQKVAGHDWPPVWPPIRLHCWPLSSPGPCPRRKACLFRKDSPEEKSIACASGRHHWVKPCRDPQARNSCTSHPCLSGPPHESAARNPAVAQCPDAQLRSAGLPPV